MHLSFFSINDSEGKFHSGIYPPYLQAIQANTSDHMPHYARSGSIYVSLFYNNMIDLENRDHIT